MLIALVILQGVRTGKLYDRVKEYEKAGTIVWVEGGDIVKAETIDSLTSRITGLEKELGECKGAVVSK